MAKVLQVAAMVVAVAAAIPSGGTSLLGAGLASAGVTAAGGAAISAATSALIATAVTVASGLVTTLTAKTPTMEGGQTEWQSDPNGPISIVVGDTLTAGSVIYRKTANNRSGGTKNYWQFVGTSLSGCGPVDAITETWVDGKPVSFVSDQATGDLAGRIYQRTQRGLCPEPAQLQPFGPWIALGGLPSWTPAHKMSGHAAVMNAFVFDGKGDNTFTQVPRMQHRLRGVMCYDPRQDSTYPGGSGPQRATDQTTWAYSTNPWVQAVTYAIGWRQGPNSIRVGGVGMPLSSIDFPAFVEAANVADANGWRSHGRILSSDDKWESLKALAQAGGGEPVRLGATLSCIINTPRVPIGTITRNDLIGNASVTTTQTRRDRINGIIPKYRSEDHGFEQVPAGVVRSASALAQDGGIERTREVTYEMVQTFAGQQPNQAAQLAGYDIANAREAGPAVFPLKLRWLGYRAGDCLTIENTPEFGYLAGKNVIVLKRQLDPDTGSVVLTMREETPSKHGWALSLTGSAAPLTDQNTAPANEAPDASEWSVSTHVEFLEGVPTGTIEFTGAVQDAGASQVVIEYRETGTAAWAQAGTLSASATQYELMGLSVSRTYDVAISYFSGLRLVFTGLTFDYAAPVPTATTVSVNTPTNPPVVSWQMPEMSGWATAQVYRGTTSNPTSSVAVSDPQAGGLYEPKFYEDDTLPAGTYWWWVRIFDGMGNLLSISTPATGTIA